MTPGELGRRMTSAEFSEAMAYEENYGIADGNFVAGLICAVIAQVFGGNRRASPADFIPIFKVPKHQTDASIASRLLGAALARNKAEARKS